MRIAVLVYGLDRIGGIKKHALCLSREYASLGHQVDVWCVEHDPVNCYPNLVNGFDIHSLRQGSRQGQNANLNGSGGGVAGYIKTLWRYYQDQLELSAIIPPGYDIVHPHGNMVSWATAIYRRRFGTAAVWLCNDFIPIASHRGSIPDGLWEKCKLGLKKVLFAPVSSYDRAAVRSMDRVAVLRNLVQNQMKTYYGIDARVIRAGVDAQAFANGNGRKFREQHDIRDKTYLILTVCSLMAHRRLQDVIQAVHRLVQEGQDVEYLIVGRTTHEPAYSKSIEKQIQEYDLQGRVKLVGEISEEELFDCYQACNVFVWASDENQSWGLAGMEAMAAGKPVIVSESSGLAEVLANEKNALLVKTRSPASIANAIMRLISNPNLASGIAHTGRRLVQEEYSWKRNATEMIGLFNEARTNMRMQTPN